MLYNLFIIDSPLQLLNAIEAKGHFKTDNNILVVISYKKHTQRHRDQIENILHTFSWDTILRIDGKAKSKFFQTIKLISKLKKNKYRYIFTGNISKSQNAIITSIKYEELYLLDDGTSTIKIYDKGKIVNFGSSLKHKFKLLRYRLFGIIIKPIDKMSFFSALHLTPKDNIKVIENDYKYLRSQSSAYKPNDDTVYFIGQNFIKAGVITTEEYIEFLNLIKLKFNDKKIIFLPHREEVLNKEYDKLLQNNFSINYFNNNVELEFILKDIYPSTVISFSSSALITLKKLYPKTNIVSLKVSHEEFTKFNQHVYDYFKDNDIEINLL